MSPLLSIRLAARDRRGGSRARPSGVAHGSSRPNFGPFGRFVSISWRRGATLGPLLRLTSREPAIAGSRLGTRSRWGHAPLDRRRTRCDTPPRIAPGRHFLAGAGPALVAGSPVET